MKKFSIIVPVYNVEKYLNKCIDSILSQTFNDFELILINDGSKDSSGDICDNYARIDDRIIAIHQQNSGVSVTRNKGLEAAKGEYVVFLDSDDYIDSHYLENFNNYNADIIITGFQIEENITQKPIHKQLYDSKLYKNISSEIFLDLYEKGYFSYCCGRAFRRCIICDNNIRFKQGLSLGEDMLFATEVATHCSSIYASDFIGYHYVRYNNELETLSSVKISSKSCVEQFEIANSLLYSILKRLNFANSEIAIAKRSSIFLLDIFNNPSLAKFSYIKYLFKQHWISKTLKYVDEVYSKESKKLRSLLKIKSPFIFWLYVKIRSFQK